MLVAVLSLACSCLGHACGVIGFLHTVLPGWLEAAGAATALFYGTRLRKPSPEDVKEVFGERPKCIGHRGAAYDAPENTIAAFNYCAENACNFVEFDVRTCGDGQLVLAHDANTRRLTGETGPDVAVTSWGSLSQLDVAAAHPNRAQFGATHMSRLDEALDFLAERDMRMIIDVKGEDKVVIKGVVEAFTSRPQLFTRAAVTTFNPLVLYQIRRLEPRIVGALSYRPYGLSYVGYDAETGPSQPRFPTGSVMQVAARMMDAVLAVSWRALATWCRVSAVFLHKDMVSPCEVAYWRSRGVHVIGWSVNRPLEKLYWRGVLQAGYLANTLVGEPLQDRKPIDKSDLAPPSEEFRIQNGGIAIEELLKEKSK